MDIYYGDKDMLLLYIAIMITSYDKNTIYLYPSLANRIGNQ